jgi:hypothetical protein
MTSRSRNGEPQERGMGYKHDYATNTGSARTRNSRPSRTARIVLAVLIAAVLFVVLVGPALASDKGPPKWHLGEERAIISSIAPKGDGCDIGAWVELPFLVRHVTGWVPGGVCRILRKGSQVYIRTRNGKISGLRLAW